VVCLRRDQGCANGVLLAAFGLELVDTLHHHRRNHDKRRDNDLVGLDYDNLQRNHHNSPGQLGLLNARRSYCGWCRGRSRYVVSP
jgi:hypothetical protein